jgi:hypothetical protein
VRAASVISANIELQSKIRTDIFDPSSASQLGSTRPTLSKLSGGLAYLISRKNAPKPDTHFQKIVPTTLDRRG